MDRRILAVKRLPSIRSARATPGMNTYTALDQGFSAGLLSGVDRRTQKHTQPRQRKARLVDET